MQKYLQKFTKIRQHACLLCCRWLVLFVQKYNGTMTTEDQNVLGAVKIVLPPPKS